VSRGFGLSRRWTELYNDRPIVRSALDLVGWAVLLYLALSVRGDSRDALAYYHATLDDIYRSSAFLSTGYVYSPAFALAVEPFRWIEPGWLILAIRLASAASLGYLVTPWLGAVLLIGQFPGLRAEFAVGNLDLLVAAALVWVLFKPSLWPALLLTKLTPGVALTWHAIRGEWRAWGLAALATVVVVLISLPWTYGGWAKWIDLTGSNIGVADAHTVHPLWFRSVVAIGVVTFAAVTDRIWLVPVAVAVSFPSPNEAHWLVLLAIPRMFLLRRPVR